MKLFLDNKEVTVAELKEANNNLELCDNDGGDYQTIELLDVDDEGNLHFETQWHSTF